MILKVSNIIQVFSISMIVYESSKREIPPPNNTCSKINHLLSSSNMVVSALSGLIVTRSGGANGKARFEKNVSVSSYTLSLLRGMSTVKILFDPSKLNVLTPAGEV